MDNKGSTLIENVVAIFVLALFGTMVSFCILSGMKSLTNTSLENQRLYHVFSQLESVDSGPDIDKKDDSELEFKFNGQEHTIEGSFYYDKDKKILGKFIRE